MLLKDREQRSPATNSGLAKVAVQCSADTFVGNQSLVLRINICGKNRHLRQAAKRYMIPLSYTNRTKNPAKKKIYNSKELHLQL